MAKTTGMNQPQTIQDKFPDPGLDTSPNNNRPRSMEFDLMPTYSRTRLGSWGDEQTHTVVRRGNKVTRDYNY